MALFVVLAFAAGAWAQPSLKGRPTLTAEQVQELSAAYSGLPVPKAAKFESISTSTDAFFYRYSSEATFDEIERDFVSQMESLGWTAQYRELGIYSFTKDHFYVALKPGESGFTVILSLLGS